MHARNPRVEFFFNKEGQWQDAFGRLRELVLDSGLTEDLKWGCPCYTHNGKNVLLIHGFKEYCAVLFMKGSLMADPENMLIRQTENVQSARQLRFTSPDEITQRAGVISMYVLEAIQVEQSGRKAVSEVREAPAISEELQQYFGKMPELRTAFEALTPGRQRAYHLFFSAPKGAKTRTARIEKSIAPILAGRGLHDA